MRQTGYTCARQVVHASGRLYVRRYVTFFSCVVIVAQKAISDAKSRKNVIETESPEQLF